MKKSMQQTAGADQSTGTHIDRTASVSTLSDEDLGALAEGALWELEARDPLGHLYGMAAGVAFWRSLCGRSAVPAFKPAKERRGRAKGRKVTHDQREDCAECYRRQFERSIEVVNPRPTERPSWSDPTMDIEDRDEGTHPTDRGVIYKAVVGEREVLERGWADPDRVRPWTLQVTLFGMRHDQGQHFDWPDQVQVHFDNTDSEDSLSDPADIRWLAETLDTAATLLLREQGERD